MPDLTTLPNHQTPENAPTSGATFLASKAWKELPLERQEDQSTGLRKRLILDEVKAPPPDFDGEGEEFLLEFTITTEDVDRDSDTISVDGWDLEHYLKNPVVLFAHNHRQLPIARSLSIWQEGRKLKSIAAFTPPDVHAFGHTVYQMYRGKYMRAVSVGFIPKEWSWTEDTDRSFGIDFKRQELLEYSAVPIPSNPHALRQAKQAGIDVDPLKEWAEEVLDNYHHQEDGFSTRDGLWLPKKSLEDIVRTLSPSTTITLGNSAPENAPTEDHPEPPETAPPEAPRDSSSSSSSDPPETPGDLEALAALVSPLKDTLSAITRLLKKHAPHVPDVEQSTSTPTTPNPALADATRATPEEAFDPEELRPVIRDIFAEEWSRKKGRL